MKVYRAVPDSFLTNKKLEQKPLCGLEGIFYQAGYSSFVGKMGYHSYNNLAENIKDEGKYFFLFAEDAIQKASSLISSYHRLRMDTCLVIEYDIPEELVLKMIGYGDYTEGIFSTYLIESYVVKSDFGNSIITTAEIADDEKKEILIKALNESLKRALNCKSYLDILYYYEYFDEKKLESIIDNRQEIARAIINSPFYKSFIDEKRQLIHSPYITGRVVPINIKFWDNELHNLSQIEAYYQNMGIDCNFSKEQKQCKEEIIYYLQQDNQDQEQIKKLLRQIKH